MSSLVLCSLRTFKFSPNMETHAFQLSFLGVEIQRPNPNKANFYGRYVKLVSLYTYTSVPKIKIKPIERAPHKIQSHVMPKNLCILYNEERIQSHQIGRHMNPK